MREAAVKTPEKTEGRAGERMSAMEALRPFNSLRREVDRLFEDFDRDFWRMPFRSARSFFDIEPFWRRDTTFAEVPAVDMVDKEGAYEITAELPGMDEKDVEVTLAEGGLTIKGEKQEEKEEKRKDYYLHERHFGSFERLIRLPEGVDTDRIEATFKRGILTVTLPKTPEAKKAEKKIDVKTA